MHRMKPLGYLGWNDQDGLGHAGGIQPADVMNLARQLQALAVMTDENYFLLLLWTICALIFSCGVVALTHHSEWFGA